MDRRRFISTLAALGIAPTRSRSAVRRMLALGASASDAGHEFFYKPYSAWPADFIPFYKDGKFHLFFLLDWRNAAAHGEGTPWYKVVTSDFVHFEEEGEMLPRGSINDQDLYVFTGSVIEASGKYHIFYTGHNPHFPALGKPQEAVMHAVSDDLSHWRKVPSDTFFAPADQFEQNDWRDPFVFWNEEVNEFWMLTAARLKAGLNRRRGCTVLSTSKDLQKWEVRRPFWEPNLYFTHECPDLFRIGDWWYLVFSEFSDLVRTRYRMSRSLSGPWIAPKEDYFDARAFYAAKTAFDGKRRFLFGWIPTRSGAEDYRRWDWGGNLAVHELHQENDGTLAVQMPTSVEQAWSKSTPVSFPTRIGNVSVDIAGLKISAPDSFACAVNLDSPKSWKLDFTLKFGAGTRGCGLMLHTASNIDDSYYVRFEPLRHQLVLDQWPRGKAAGDSIPSVEGEHVPDMARWVQCDPQIPFKVKVIVDGTIAIIYVNHKIAMSMRLYDLDNPGWGFFVTQGTAEITDIKMEVLNSEA